MIWLCECGNSDSQGVVRGNYWGEKSRGKLVEVQDERMDIDRTV